MSDVVAVILWVGVIAYAVLGGADFGVGFWDLTAGGARRGARLRHLLTDSIAPVWEANHVWLIFCLVVLWTAFPDAFASVMSTLWVPLTLAAFGIVLRGSAFAFRKTVETVPTQRLFGATFAASSVITPFFLGAVAGGIASGRVPPGNVAGDTVSSWVNPTSILGGVLAVAACAYLSAVFLVAEARRRDAEDLVQAFRRRAIGAAVAVGAIALAGIFVLEADAPRLFDNLTGRALPIAILSGLLGLGALALLWRESVHVVRVVAAAAVATVIVAWGVAQYPEMLGDTLSIDEAAAPDVTLAVVVGVFLVAAVTILPAIAYLFVLSQRGELEPEELDEEVAASPATP